MIGLGYILGEISIGMGTVLIEHSHGIRLIMP